MSVDETPKWKMDEYDLVVDTWFERDRKNVSYHLKINKSGDDNSVSVASFWDDDVTQEIESGFLDPRDWRGSGFTTLKERGRVEEIEKRVNDVLPSIYDAAEAAALTFDGDDADELVPAALPESIRAEAERLPWSAIDILRERVQYIMDYERPEVSAPAP